MEAEDWLAAARRQRLVFVNLIALGLIVAGLVTMFSPKEYRSEGALFGVATNRQITSGDLYYGTMLVQYRMPTYVELATSATVLTPVIASLDLRTTPAELASRMSVTRDEGSASMSIAVRDARPARATAIVDAVSAELIDVAGKLESNGTATSPVALRVQSAGTVPSGPSGPSAVLDLGIGLVAGVVASLLVWSVYALVLSLRRRRVQAMWLYVPEGDVDRLVLARVLWPSGQLGPDDAAPQPRAVAVLDAGSGRTALTTRPHAEESSR